MSELSTPLIAVTHLGRHHADELLACWFLTLLHEDVRIVRTGNAELWEHADVLLDVGGIYDPAAGRFDHHGQAGVPRPPEGRLGPFATAGLLWQLYGPLLCRHALACCPASSWHTYAASQAPEILERHYAEFSATLDQEIVALIDAWDVGIYPPKHSTRQVLPLQWLLPHLEFEHAMEALGRAFLQRLVTVAEILADAQLLSDELWENGPCEFYSWKGWLVISAPAHRHVELLAGKRFAGRTFRAPLLAVIGSVRGGQKWGAFFVSPLPERVKVPAGFDYPAGRRAVFHYCREELLDFVRRCADMPLPAGWEAW